MDAAWCATQPFKRRIAHGTLILSIGVGLVADAINQRAISYGYADAVRFIKPVFIGDTIATELTIGDARAHPRRPGSGIGRRATADPQPGRRCRAGLRSSGC